MKRARRNNFLIHEGKDYGEFHLAIKNKILTDETR